MKSVCVVSSIVGGCYFIFGTLCLAAPFLLECDYRGDNAGLLTLDEIGVFAAITGAVLYGTSMIALAMISKKSKPD